MSREKDRTPYPRSLLCDSSRPNRLSKSFGSLRRPSEIHPRPKAHMPLQGGVRDGSTALLILCSIGLGKPHYGHRNPPAAPFPIRLHGIQSTP